MHRRLLSIPVPSRFFLRGPCLYFTRGYIGFRLVKNLTPSTPDLSVRRLPREEKSMGPSIHCANLRKRKRKFHKRKNYSTSPFCYFLLVVLTQFLHIVLLQHVLVPRIWVFGAFEHAESAGLWSCHGRDDKWVFPLAVVDTGFW